MRLRHLILVVAVLICVSQCQAATSTVDISAAPKESAPKDKVLCNVCQFFVKEMSKLVATNKSVDEVKAVAIKACSLLPKSLKLDSVVCRGMVEEMAPIFVYVFRNTRLNETDMCDYMGICEVKDFRYDNEEHVPLHAHVNLNLNLPRTIKVLAVGDIHVDPDYVVGSPAKCQRPMCCRPDSPPVADSFPAPKYTSDSCDVSTDMLKVVLQHMSVRTPRPDMVFFLGDIPPHDLWAQATESSNKLTHDTYTLFKQAFKGIPFFPVLGDHEAYPCDQYDPKVSTALTEFIAKEWADWLPMETLDTVKRGGFYSLLLKTGLRLVVLNTMQGDLLNFYELMGPGEWAEQTNWVVDILEHSRANKEKVLLLGHMPPPGIHHSYPVYTNWFRSLAANYSDVIEFSTFAHTHKDEFTVARDANGVPKVVMHIIPSITTYSSGHNPGYRIYEIDTTTGKLVNYEQWALNITKLVQEDKAEWWLSYDAQSEYGLKDMSAASWFALAEKFRKDDRSFDKFMSNLVVRAPHTQCRSTCKINQICSLKNSDAKGYLSCLEHNGY